MRTSFLLRAAGLAMLTTLHLPGAALAQYVWVDEKGVKQFSDMPPPASVPMNRILKQPGMRAAASEPASGTAAAGDTPAAKTLAEQNAEFKKRRTEQADQEKKATDDARLAAEKIRNCERARNYQRALESGTRLAQVDNNGERAFLTDEQREHELRETAQALQDCE